MSADVALALGLETDAKVLAALGMRAGRYRRKGVPLRRLGLGRRAHDWDTLAKVAEEAGDG